MFSGPKNPGLVEALRLDCLAAANGYVFSGPKNPGLVEAKTCTLTLRVYGMFSGPKNPGLVEAAQMRR